MALKEKVVARLPFGVNVIAVIDVERTVMAKEVGDEEDDRFEFDVGNVKEIRIEGEADSDGLYQLDVTQGIKPAVRVKFDKYKGTDRVEQAMKGRPQITEFRYDVDLDNVITMLPKYNTKFSSDSKLVEAGEREPSPTILAPRVRR